MIRKYKKYLSSIRHLFLFKILFPLIKNHGRYRLPLSKYLNTLAIYYQYSYDNSIDTDPNHDGEYWLLRTLASQYKFNIIDIGGHHGEYSKEFLKNSPDSNSLIIEPVEIFNSFLQKNLQFFLKKEKVKIKNIAASNKINDFNEFYFNKKGSGTGSSFYNDINKEDIEKIIVKTSTIDKIILEEKINKEKIGLIKIDAEGHEREILEGAKGILKSVGIVQLEYSYYNSINDWPISKIYKQFENSFFVGVLLPNSIEIINEEKLKKNFICHFNPRNIVLINKGHESHPISKIIMNYVKFD